jgi:glycosyltransferase involved in cell wall biosynthesis
MIPNFGADDGVDPLPAHDRAGWLALGRFSSEKGFEQLLQSWPQGHHLDIIGNGDEEKNIVALAARTGVRVESSVSREELRERLPRYLGLVFPSRWLEVAPQVVVEAMRFGLPVVAFEANGVSEMVCSTNTGKSYADSESLKQALDQTLGDLDGFSQRAINHYRLKWRPSVWLDSMTGLYEHLMADAD